MRDKLKPDILIKHVLSRIGLRDRSVIGGPSIGEDAAVIDLGDGRALVVHVDPITGAVEYLGWLAVNIACNDVAVAGAKPRWLLQVLYLPEGTSVEVLNKITLQVDSAARELETMVVGGHSEYTPGIERPLISMTAIGLTEIDKLVRTSGAKPGDKILMTKTAGIEGTAILSSDFREDLLKRGVSGEVLEKCEEYIWMISVVKEALALASRRITSSMHDPTEGGVLGGLAEIAYSSKKSLEVWEERIPVSRETRIICNVLNIDPLKMISSGVLIATVPENLVDEALRVLGEIGVKATIIGEVRDWRGYLVRLHRRSGEVEEYSDVYVEDEVMRLWSKK